MSFCFSARLASWKSHLLVADSYDQILNISLNEFNADFAIFLYIHISKVGHEGFVEGFTSPIATGVIRLRTSEL